MTLTRRSIHSPSAVSARFAVKLYDNQFDAVHQIVEADVYRYSGINQDCGVLNEIRAALHARYPKALHIIGGPIRSSFEAAGRNPFVVLTVLRKVSCYDSWRHLRRKEGLVVRHLRCQITAARAPSIGLFAK